MVSMMKMSMSVLMRGIQRRVVGGVAGRMSIRRIQSRGKMVGVSMRHLHEFKTLDC